MIRKLADCRQFPSESGCTLTLAGEEEEVIRAATEHAVSVHGHLDSRELQDQIRGNLRDESVISASGSRSFDRPDEIRQFKAHGRLKVLNFEDGHVIGKAVFEPGWKWRNDVKPIAGTENCQNPHAGYCLQGEMEVRMIDGRTFTIRAGDAFEIAPGHDAWVVGLEACEMIDFAGYANYAQPTAAKKAA